MTFRNRKDAAEILAALLAPSSGTCPLVLGVPCGGLPMARVVADRRAGDFDVVLVRRLSAPDDPDVEIGSIDEDGQLYINDVPRQEGISREYVEREKAISLASLKARRAFYTPGRSAFDPRDRVVILVADTVPEETLLLPAIRAMRRRGAARVIVAVAAAPSDVIEHLENEADEVVCACGTSGAALADVFADQQIVCDREAIDAFMYRPLFMH